MASLSEADRKFCAGNDAFVDEDFDLAIQCYTEALELAGPNADYFLKRSNAHIKKRNFSEAVKDADSAIELNPDDIRPHQRRGYAFFAMEKYQDALRSYENALRLNENNDQIKQWIRKCEAELNLSENQDGNKDPAIGISKLHKPNKNNTESKSESEEKPVEAAKPVSKIKHDWYQTETHIVITVLAKNLNKDHVKVDFTEKTLSLTAKLPSGSEYSLELDLAHPIFPDQSISRVLSTKIEVKMKKKEGIRWSSLETDNESQFVNTKNTSKQNSSENVAHKYPTSRHVYTDWDKLEREVLQEEKNEEPEGDAALNKLFQKIYADGSDEVKRAMNKSFQESGGTVLSTNWSEVKKETIDVKPPDCMEYKKYEY